MTGQESTDNKLNRLEKEIRELTEMKETATRREEQLISKLREYENAFYTELDSQARIYRQTWTWRIGRLFVGPADRIVKLFRSKKKTGTELINPVPDPSKNNIAVIFDTFTHSCFSPEFNPVRFTPFSWKKVLQDIPVKGLIIESAWNGNEGHWSGEIATTSVSSADREVFRLISRAKNQKIPAIFWNKEDPVHFGQFIEVAKNCDYIFTTDGNCIPAYRKQAPEAALHVLPFAAQPKIHNPVSSSGRDRSVCFAGSYYGGRYHERKTDMDLLLKPALDFNLEIFDRYYGEKGNVAEKNQFPTLYNAAVKGKLNYSEMVEAYKKYKVFLNVNSVKYSPTMCARRVFELLACGTPVISAYSQGIISLLGEGTVLISESESDTRKHLEYLLDDELNWWRVSLNGLRKVMSTHTYEERARYLFEIAGIENIEPVRVKFSVVSMISEMQDAMNLKSMLEQQQYSNFDIILVPTEKDISVDLQGDEIRSLFTPFTVKLLEIQQSNLEDAILQASDSNWIAFLHQGKYYGPNYLNDYALAVKYSNAGIIGKKSFYTRGEGNKPAIQNKGFEYKYVDLIPNSTSVHRKDIISKSRMRDYLAEGYVENNESLILSTDPFNYLDSAAGPADVTINDQVLCKINL